MKELQRLRSQLSSADYHHVIVLILGMLTMLVGSLVLLCQLRKFYAILIAAVPPCN
ncbi:hypothetical protein V6R94_01250 [Pediococcus acidilactici]